MHFNISVYSAESLSLHREVVTRTEDLSAACDGVRSSLKPRPSLQLLLRLRNFNHQYAPTLSRR